MSFDPLAEHASLVRRLSQLEPGVIQVAQPAAGCAVRGSYIQAVMQIVHSHLLVMVNDIHGNLPLELAPMLDPLLDVAGDISGSINNAIEQLLEEGE